MVMRELCRKAEAAAEEGERLLKDVEEQAADLESKQAIKNRKMREGGAQLASIAWVDVTAKIDACTSQLNVSALAKQ